MERSAVAIGYYTYFSGVLTITPPIDDTKYEEFKSDSDGEFGYFKFTQMLGDEDVKIVDGVITVVGTTAGYTQLDIDLDESIKGYNFDECLAELINRAKAEGCVVEGAIYGDGEESGDFWCASVKNNVATSERGEIVYPSNRYSPISAAGERMRAHGNVIPRPDGQRRTCLNTCEECDKERTLLAKLMYGRP